MTRAALILAAPLVLALAACGHRDKESSVTITTSDDGKTTTTTTRTKGNTASADATSSIELKLPGGFEAKVKAPKMFGDMTHIDIDGVGLYPGAQIGAVNVNASAAENDHNRDATVGIGFTSADAPGKVADWYATQFAAKGRAVTRSGDTISGKTKDDGDFIIALTPGDGGNGSKGQISIKSS